MGEGFNRIEYLLRSLILNSQSKEKPSEVRSPRPCSGEFSTELIANTVFEMANDILAGEVVLLKMAVVQGRQVVEMGLSWE